MPSTCVLIQRIRPIYCEQKQVLQFFSILRDASDGQRADLRHKTEHSHGKYSDTPPNWCLDSVHNLQSTCIVDAKVGNSNDTEMPPEELFNRLYEDHDEIINELTKWATKRHVQLFCDKSDMMVKASRWEI
ncbi:hypothetical protein MUCCIDRAFT_115618 [Mucor lusitanicus CBS 277.49]|uniref:Uncharacterized protein n=1 Tax=Mucor lusitanicus CBS 277.49 TaxID=747725 RepID=A0A168GWJ8_MUCCL|nr:hypothetical protein MUCCIDRAFT_115618 [Mucor lusitanicus CBS 277.49]